MKGKRPVPWVASWRTCVRYMYMYSRICIYIYIYLYTCMYIFAFRSNLYRRTRTSLPKDVFFSLNLLDSRVRWCYSSFTPRWLVNVDRGFPPKTGRPPGGHCGLASFLASWKRYMADQRSLDRSNIILLVYCLTVDGRKGLVVYPTRFIPLITFFAQGFYTSQVLQDFFQQQYVISSFFQWLSLSIYKVTVGSEYVPFDCIFMYLKDAIWCLLLFDAQLLQRTWQKSRILVVKSHDGNPGHRPASLFKLMTCNDRSPMSASENSKFCKQIYECVSKNRGTPKSSILIGFSIINHPFWGYPHFFETLLWRCENPNMFSFPLLQQRSTGPGGEPCSSNFDVGSCSCSLLWHVNVKAYNFVSWWMSDAMPVVL